MTLRKVPAALALGLLASLGAHAALYGREHAMGGAYNALLFEAALTGVVALLIFFGGLAWTEAGRTADGSVMAVRLRARLPSVFSVLTATLLWFIVGERIEPHHAVASLGMTALALALGAYVVRWLANAVAETFARAVITVLRLSFSPRAPSWHRRKRTRPIARRIAWTRRRFARPPPILA